MAIMQHRSPDIQLVFTNGNYHHALQCHIAARSWVAETGQALRPDICGVVKQPHHPKCPAGEHNVPLELIETNEWSLTVDIWCADANALEWLRSLPLPENSRLIPFEVNQWPDEIDVQEI